MKFWPHDKLMRAFDGLELSRDLLASVRDYLQAKIANDQNEVMKKLTVIASILLLPTFIVGPLSTIRPTRSRMGERGAADVEQVVPQFAESRARLLGRGRLDVVLELVDLRG